MYWWIKNVINIESDIRKYRQNPLLIRVLLYRAMWNTINALKKYLWRIENESWNGLDTAGKLNLTMYNTNPSFNMV